MMSSSFTMSSSVRFTPLEEIEKQVAQQHKEIDGESLPLTESNIQQAKEEFLRLLHQRSQHAVADEVAQTRFILAEDKVMEIVLSSAYAQHIFQQLEVSLRHFLTDTLPLARNYRLRIDFTPAEKEITSTYLLPSEVYEIMQQRYPLIKRFKEDLGFDIS